MSLEALLGTPAAFRPEIQAARPHVGQATSARRLVEQLGLERHFVAMVGGGETPRGKPDPAPLELAAERAGVPLHETLLVGDSQSDVRAARSAGIPVVCVSYGYNHGEVLRAGPGPEEADVIGESLEALL